MSVPRDRLRRLIEPVVTAAGADLEDVLVRQAGRRQLLQVFVDRDGGITLDDVARISSEVSNALDASDVFGDDPYTLEVGSPGIDRPLTLPRHWRRALGRLVLLTDPDGTSFTGRVIEVDESGATLQAGSQSRTYAFADVGRAVVEVEFGRAAEGDLDEEA